VGFFWAMRGVYHPCLGETTGARLGGNLKRFNIESL
jgi:hypothetical protein